MALGSFFSGLFQKKPPAEPPSSLSTHGHSQPQPAESGEARIRRRLAVDQAVNVALTAAGIASSGCKHDIKRMDPNGMRFMVTLDLNAEYAELSAHRLAQVGATITQLAGAKGEAEVTAVYWRLEPGAVTAPSAARRAEAPAAAPPPAPVAPKEAASEKIAKLRAMMKEADDAAPEHGSDAAFQKTQVMDEVDTSSFEKTQVIRKQ